MNERIRELANCNERIQNFFETGPVQRAAIEQFAELIIQECINKVEVWEKDSRNHISYMLKEYFGVKNDIT